MAWILDTNILSEIRRLKPEPKVLAFIDSSPLDGLYISAVTLADLRFGIELLNGGSARRAALDTWLTGTIRPMFERRVLPVTEDIMFKWRVLLEDGRKTGHTFSQPDLIIGATAAHHGLTVVPPATGATSTKRGFLSSIRGRHEPKSGVSARLAKGDPKSYIASLRSSDHPIALRKERKLSAPDGPGNPSVTFMGTPDRSSRPYAPTRPGPPRIVRGSASAER